jgi:hypothetical protein
MSSEHTGAAPSARGVGQGSRLADSATGGQSRGGLDCQCCGGSLRSSTLGEGRTGALKEHVVCESCGATGCLVTNMTGRTHVREHGRALRGGRR